MDLKRDCGSRWHAIDWDAALAGSVVADHLFLRSGVIRKDLLPAFCGRTTPPTGTCANYAAVAALLHDRNTSAIVTLRSSGIDAPRKLDGKTYASYAARFEGRIVQKMIQADGGKGDFAEATPPMLGIWNTLLAGNADATWVFRQWEGCEAELRGVAAARYACP